jgi:hypothetical protein
LEKSFKEEGRVFSIEKTEINLGSLCWQKKKSGNALNTTWRRGRETTTKKKSKRRKYVI